MTLLILTRSAWGIEVEPNNDSAHANPLNTENSGKLNRASDVDFFSIDSCLKDAKKQCVKYTVADEKLDATHKAGSDKRREEISISFTCNNRSTSTASSGGWFLGIHDTNGELQETYPVKPEDCVINDTNTVPFNFKFSTLDSPNYYVSVVSDCAAPIYNTVTDPKDATKNIVTVNKFVTAVTAKQIDIDAAKLEIPIAQSAIDFIKTDLNYAENGFFEVTPATPATATTPAVEAVYAPAFSFINSNVNLKNMTDALALASDITNLASTTLTPATNISAAMSVSKAVEIAASAMHHSFSTFGQVLLAQDAVNNPAIAKAIENADAALAIATTTATQAAAAATAADKALSDAQAALVTAKSKVPQIASDITDANDAIAAANNRKTGAKDGTGTAGTDGAKIEADNAKTLAENAKKAADNVKTAADKALSDAKAKDTEATTKLTDALKALDDAVKSLTDTVKANIDAANTAQNLSTRFDSACKNNYNIGTYTLKDNPDNETKRLEYITSNAQKNLGLEQSGQISALNDMDIYVVDSDGTNDVPLLFTCGTLAFRQTNDWKVSVFNDTTGLVNTQLINGSSCGSVFIGDKGGQSIKLPKGSQRYYLAVESACTSSDRADCVVDTSEYSILRDVDKVYSGKLSSKKIDATSADLKLTNCGLNNNAVISIKAENVDLATASKLGTGKLPINVQIGSTACRILTPDLSTKDALIGTVMDSSKIIDSVAKAQDSANIILSDCGNNANAKVTLTGSRLDLIGLNPNNEANSVIIPLKVNIGDFHCESREVFTFNSSESGITYSNVIDPVVVTPVVNTPSVIDPITALAMAKNISALQTNKLQSITDVQAYYVDTALNTDVNFEFSCPNSVRFTNDWALSVYNKDKKLISTQLIDGSACGTGSVGDTGTFKFSALKNSTRSYFVVKSACETSDSVCVVDSSQYQIKRIVPTSTTTNSNNTTATTTNTSTCFYGSCSTSVTTDTPIFGAK